MQGSQSQTTPEVSILLVEDNENDILVFQALARNIAARTGCDFAVDTCRTLAEAHDACRSGKKHDIAVIDLCLPDSSGFNTLAAIAAVGSGSKPIAILTGSQDAELNQQALELADDLVGVFDKTRTFGDDILSSKLARALRLCAESKKLEARITSACEEFRRAIRV